MAVYVERFVVGFSVRLEFFCCEDKCDVKEVSGSLVGMGRNFKVEVAENLYKVFSRFITQSCGCIL